MSQVYHPELFTQQMHRLLSKLLYNQNFLRFYNNHVANKNQVMSVWNFPFHGLISIGLFCKQTIVWRISARHGPLFALAFTLVPASFSAASLPVPKCYTKVSFSSCTASHILFPISAVILVATFRRVLERLRLVGLHAFVSAQLLRLYYPIAKYMYSGAFVTETATIYFISWSVTTLLSMWVSQLSLIVAAVLTRLLTHLIWFWTYKISRPCFNIATQCECRTTLSNDSNPGCFHVQFLLTLLYFMLASHFLCDCNQIRPSYTALSYGSLPTKQKKFSLSSSMIKIDTVWQNLNC